MDMGKEKYFTYLNSLRESGAMNMYGAAPYLASDFPELTQSEANAVLKDWMNSFSRKEEA